ARGPDRQAAFRARVARRPAVCRAAERPALRASHAEALRPPGSPDGRGDRAQPACAERAHEGRGEAAGRGGRMSRAEWRELALAALLAVAVVGSGLLLIRAEHDARRLFIELEELNREHDRLQIDWGRLQIEQSTWATHARVESLARGQPHLGAPKPDQ